jgi:hypothetical protein
MDAVPNPHAIKTTMSITSSSWLTVDLLFPLRTNISIPLPIGCKGLVKGVLRDFYVRKRTPIHPSAWKVNSPKFACRIVHRERPLRGARMASKALPAACEGSIRLVVLDGYARRRLIRRWRSHSLLNGRLLRRIRDESGEAIMGGDSYARKKTKERSLTSPLSRFYRESSASYASFCGG